MHIYIRTYLAIWCFLLFQLVPSQVDAAPVNSAIDLIAKTGEINLTVAEDQQKEAFLAVLKRAETYRASNEKEALNWIACAVARANVAKFGGMSALGQMKDVRAELERAIEIDPNALNGYAQAFLGRMYSAMPGWPIGYGSNKTAKKYLLEALSINATTAENNYYYGLVLKEDKKYKQAMEYMQKAKDATFSIDQPMWKANIQKYIAEELTTLAEKL